MDAAQFQQLLQAFASQQSQMIQQLVQTFQSSNTDPTGRASQDQVTNLVPFEHFDSKKEKFANYLERFDNYVAMKNITDPAKKAQLLCASVGPTHYNGLAAYLGPEKSIKTLDYDTLVQSFNEFLSPKKSAVVAQHYFLSITQKEKQSVTEYLAALQKDLVDCEFQVTCSCNKTVSANELFLRAQFIRGLRDSWLREQLLQSTFVKFDEVINKAIALEASRIESKELEQKTMEPTPTDINKITRGSTKRTPKATNRESRPTQSRSSSISYRSFSKDRRHRSQSQSLNRRNYESRKKFVDYAALGIDNLCFKCGKNNHKAQECYTDRNSLQCQDCGKKGHVSKVCITTLLNKSRSKEGQNTVSQLSPLFGIDTNLVELYDLSNTETVRGAIDDKYYVTVSLNGKPQRMEVDSGARFSIISEPEFNKLQLQVPIETTSTVFRSYSGNLIPVRGKVRLCIQYKGRSVTSSLFIVPSGHATLLGREWIRALGIELKEIDTLYPDVPRRTGKELCTVEVLNVIGSVLSEYSELFVEKIGCIPHVTVQLELRKGAKPVFNRERQVPFALRERVDSELDALQTAGIITPIEYSDWGSPLVAIPKANGGIRLCVDYKTGVNERLVSANNPIPKIDEILHQCRSARVFCKLDLYKAYLHLPVSPESAKIQTITTHRGTYTMNRLSFGIKTAPSIFNRVMSQIFREVPGTLFYFDDIIIYGSSQRKCEENLRLCLDVLKRNNLHLNREKCSFFKEEIEYLGYVIGNGQIKKSQSKINAIQNMPRPQHADEVRRFLGLVTYYSKFIPNFSNKTAPLRRLLRQNAKFKWTAECEASFLKLKTEICSERVLTPFNPELPIILTTDAGPSGIAAVLSHQIENEERPVAFASRSLTSSEQNYSQLDKEALAIIYGVTYFYNYIFGSKFTLVTDNEPLTRIFHPQKPLPKMTSARLLRFASFLAGFDYSVKFKKGLDNKNVDALSRAPPVETNDVLSLSPESFISQELDEYYEDKLFQISNMAVTASVIASETQKDPELGPVLQKILTSDTPSDYTVVKGVLFRNDRVVIPVSLRRQLLDEIHSCHLGIQKMKQLARRYVYWKSLDKEIENIVKSCTDCARNQANPPKVSVHPWDTPSQNWERVHIDHAGQFQNHWFLIVMDARSKWAEVEVENKAPTTESTIQLLQKICSTHGYPKVIVSDNAPVFTSIEFRTFCHEHGITNKYIAPNHPATNGLAERNVQTLKRRLKAIENESGSIQEKIQRILLKYRATPLASGKSPAENYLNRKIRLRMDAIFPAIPKQSQPSPLPSRILHEGDRVQARMFDPKKHRLVWEFGKVQRQLGSRHYLIQLDNGRTLKRHINQLRSTCVPRKVSFGPIQYTSFPSRRVPRSNTTPTSDPLEEQRVDPDPVGEPEQEPVPVPGPPPQEVREPAPVRGSNRIRRAPARFQDYQLY